MTPPTPTEADKKLAEQLFNGKFFEQWEVAQLIADHCKPEREALIKGALDLRLYGRHLFGCTVESNDVCQCGLRAALAAIEKVIK